MEREQANYDPSPVALGTSVTPNYRAIQPEQYHPYTGVEGYDTNAGRLADSLGIATNQATSTIQQAQAVDNEQQLQKVPLMVQQFRDAHGSGSVSMSQITQQFSTNPIITARIAESLGNKRGSDAANTINQEISQNNALKLDPIARNEFITKRITELSEEHGAYTEGNDFFGSGYAEAISDNMVRFNSGYEAETQKYHTAVQEDGFSKAITDDILYKGGHRLEQIDANWSTTSSLDHLKRKELVVKTVIDNAHTYGSPQMLDNIPDKFLNAESKNLILKAKQEIASNGWANYSRGQTLAKDQKEQMVSAGKTQILQEIMDGKHPDIRAYATKDPELGAYAQQQTNAITVPDSISAEAVLTFKTEAMTGATFGEGFSQKDLVASVQNNTKMNPVDKQKLIGEIPELQQGMRLLKDPSVLDASKSLDTNITDSLASPMGQMSKLTGVNVRSTVMNEFNSDLRNRFNSYWQETGKYPVGNAKDDIVDKARARAEERIIKLANSQSGANKPAASDSNRSRNNEVTPPTDSNTIQLKGGGTATKLN